MTVSLRESTSSAAAARTAAAAPLLLIEQTLGHRTHGINLGNAASNEGEGTRVMAHVVGVEYSERGRVPLPWAFRGSWQAMRLARERREVTTVAFYHTQTVSLFAPLGGRPYVVSTDATPRQIDAMAKWYQHTKGSSLTETPKRLWYRAVMARAKAVVAWSEWAADSLVKEYGVRREKIVVAHPGAPRFLFEIERGERKAGPVRILFVGGDFERKGGPELLEAFAPLADRAELVLMTEAEVAGGPGVRIERGVRPTMSRFRELFEAADVFCLPTLGDCTPLAIGEGLAAGLPVVTSRIGSNAETIREGDTGLLVAPGDVLSIRAALTKLVDDESLRRRMGEAARDDARLRFDADVNAGRVLKLLAEVAS